MAKIFYSQKKPDCIMEFEDSKAVTDFMETAQNGRWRLEFIRDRKPKTPNQLGYIFAGVINAIKEEANENRQDGVDHLLRYLINPDIPKGQAVTTDFVKELCYTVAPTYRDGRRRTLSSMNDLEAGSLIDRILNIFAMYTDIPDPREKK